MSGMEKLLRVGVWRIRVKFRWQLSVVSYSGMHGSESAAVRADQLDPSTNQRSVVDT